MKLKLKVRVTAKDLTLFGLFCVILLYLSSIVVLNVSSIINKGEFYGFNPLAGFWMPYLPITIVLFLGVLAVIFFSVSSTIFELTKGGPGLKIGEKDSDGYARWMEESEMKKAFKVFKVGVTDDSAEHGGIVLINDGKNMWVDDSEFHTLVVGVTGSGKTTAVIDPLVYSLAKSRESMVFTDPKGEIYRNHATYLRHLGYNVIVLNFREPSKGNAWNPLLIPYKLYKEGNKDKAFELIDDIAANIMKDESPGNDPFWQNSSSDYLSACILALFEDAKEEEINLKSINYMTTVGEDKFGGNSNYMKEYFKFKGEASTAYVRASNTINSPNETKGGILATFREKISKFGSRDTLSEMLAYSDFDMEDVGKKPTALFLLVQDEKTTYHGLATIFIKQLYEKLIDVAQNSPQGALPVRVNFLLDEFANMPALKDITTMVTAARSRRIRFTFIIQNYSQLDKVYGKEEAQTIKSNCQNLMYLLTTELAALEEISKLCGEVKSKKEDKTASVPLITVADLQKLKMNEVIIIRNRQHPFRTTLKQAFAIDWGDGEYKEPAELPIREERTVALFDIKNFVDVRKRSEMKKNGESSPFGGGSSFGMGGGYSGGGISDPFSAPSSKPAGGLPSFADIMSGGMSGLNNPSGPRNSTPGKIPSFEEFMAAKNTQKPKVDIDDLVKKIDEQIARLEEEERQEKAKQESITAPEKESLNPFTTDNKVVFEDNVQTPPFEEKVKEEEPVQTVERPVVQEQPTQTGTTFKDLFSNIDNIPNPVESHVSEEPAVVVEQTQPQVPVQPTLQEQPVYVAPQKIEQPIVQEQPTNIINTPPANFDAMINSNINSVPVQPQEQIIQTPVQPQTNVKVDTQSQVVDTTKDDEYFDDFFE